MNKTSRVPEWLTAKTGEPNRVPAPWTPVKLDARSVYCWGRKHVFDRTPVLAQVENQKRALLAGPIELNYAVAGKGHTWGVCETAALRRQPQGLWAEREATGEENGLMLRSTVRLYYEGALKVDLVLHPLKPMPIDRLSLVIPFRPEQAAIGCAKMAVIPTDQLPPQGTWGAFDPPALWLGTDEVGLGWFSESNWGWDEGAEVLGVVRRKDRVEIVIRVIDQRRDLAAPFALSFGLQANPWKPVSKAEKAQHIYHSNWMYDLTEAEFRRLRDCGVNVLIFHSYWTDLHAYPETPYEQELKRLVKLAHRYGMKLGVYFGAEFSCGAPEWPTWGERWKIGYPQDEYIPAQACPADPVPPGGFIPPQNCPTYYLPPGGFREKDMLARPKNMGQAVPAPHVCFRSEWPDFILNRIDRLLRKYDLDGLFLDGWTEWGQLCSNPLHGCGHSLPDGSRKGTYLFWSCRELLERAYVTVKSFKKDGVIDLHAQPGMGFMSGPFGTSCLAGEGYGSDFKNAKPLAVRVLQMGADLWGVYPSDLISEFDMYSGLTIGLLHNVMPRAGRGNTFYWCNSFAEQQLAKWADVFPQAAVWRIRRAFGMEQAEWHPYWQNAELTACGPPSVLTSFWNRPGRGTLWVISNLGTETAPAELKIPWKKLGYRDSMQALDLWPMELPIQVSAEGLSGSLPAWRFRLVFAAPEKSKLWPALRACRAWVLEQMALMPRDEWLLLGPFGAADAVYKGDVDPGYRGLETPFIPEDKVDVGARYRVATGEERGWEKMVVEFCLDLPTKVARQPWDVFYAYTRILVPPSNPPVTDLPVELCVRHCHACRIWLNGREIFKHGGAGTPRYGQGRWQKRIAAKLHPGWNPLLVKMVTRRGAQFFLKVAGPGGRPLPVVQRRV